MRNTVLIASAAGLLVLLAAGIISAAAGIIVEAVSNG
jgi:hypothetical protein